MLWLLSIKQMNKQLNIRNTAHVIKTVKEKKISSISLLITVSNSTD